MTAAKTLTHPTHQHDDFSTATGQDSSNPLDRPRQRRPLPLANKDLPLPEPCETPKLERCLLHNTEFHNVYLDVSLDCPECRKVREHGKANGYARRHAVKPILVPIPTMHSSTDPTTWRGTQSMQSLHDNPDERASIVLKALAENHANRIAARQEQTACNLAYDALQAQRQADRHKQLAANDMSGGFSAPYWILTGACIGFWAGVAWMLWRWATGKG